MFPIYDIYDLQDFEKEGEAEYNYGLITIPTNKLLAFQSKNFAHGTYTISSFKIFQVNVTGKTKTYLDSGVDLPTGLILIDSGSIYDRYYFLGTTIITALDALTTGVYELQFTDRTNTFKSELFKYASCGTYTPPPILPLGDYDKDDYDSNDYST